MNLPGAFGQDLPKGKIMQQRHYRNATEQQAQHHGLSLFRFGIRFH